ncbi:MAG: hypothetical protein EA376_12900 [Phycisphaeraceae bacterium]|nr:MAG: hypothetical protein EA376_12900 [Phycisphaeraceae bacterium]
MSFRLTSLTAAAAALAIAATSASATITFDVIVTADNQYGLYTGTETSADVYIGGAFNTLASGIVSPESYNLTLPNDGYIYITAWADRAVFQGLMARFDSSLGTFYAGQEGWEVTATGLSRPNGAPPVPESDLTTQILLANAGMNPAGGWVEPHLGPLNSDLTIWPFMIGGGMGPDANWTWYDSGNDPSPNAPYVNGFDHEEYLIFRLPVNVPTPGALALMGLAAPVALRRRRN